MQKGQLVVKEENDEIVKQKLTKYESKQPMFRYESVCIYLTEEWKKYAPQLVH